METYHDNWNACLLFRNKQLTKQLKDYQNASALAEFSFPTCVYGAIALSSSASVLRTCPG